MLPPPEDATHVKYKIKLGYSVNVLYNRPDRIKYPFFSQHPDPEKKIFETLACLGDGSFIQTIRFFRGLLVCPPQDVGGSTLKEQFVN